MENQFFPSILSFMDASPKEFISELNKVFLTVWRLKLDETLAAYQTLNVLMSLHGKSLDENHLKVVAELRDRAILGRLIKIAEETYYSSERSSVEAAIESVVGKPFCDLKDEVTGVKAERDRKEAKRNCYLRDEGSNRHRRRR